MQEVLNFIKEFEGIIGAVFGAVSTLVVTDLLKRKGKLNIYLMSYKGNYYYYNEDNFGFNSISTQKSDNSELRYYQMKFIVDVYNSSELPKIMRDIKLNVYKGKELLTSLDINDEDTRRISQARCMVIDKVSIFNINQKESYSFNLCVEIPKEFVGYLADGVVFKLCYKNENNKNKYFEIFSGKIIEEVED